MPAISFENILTRKNIKPNRKYKDCDHYRSRDRIRDLGEVFTPEKYAKQMLDLFDPSVWKDEDSIFFEPCAGRGNIVLPILERRVATLEKKYRKEKKHTPELRALAISLNTFWAIDICPDNVNCLRERILSFSICYLLKRKVSLVSAKRKSYLAHVLCTLLWQIQENEALSALSTEAQATSRAQLTKTGQKWLGNNDHLPLIFDNDWCSHFNSDTRSKKALKLFDQSLSVVDKALSEEKGKYPAKFFFAKNAFELISPRASDHASGVAR